MFILNSVLSTYRNLYNFLTLSHFRDFIVNMPTGICRRDSLVDLGDALIKSGQHRQKHTETYLQTDGKRTSRASDTAFLMALRQPGDAYI